MKIISKISLSLAFFSISLFLFSVKPINAQSWSFETTNDDAVPGDWDAKHVGTPAWADVVLDNDIKQEGTGSYKFDNNHIYPSGVTDFYVYKKFETTGKHYKIKAWYRFSGFVSPTFTDNVLVIYYSLDAVESANPDDWYYLLNLTVNPTGNVRIGTVWDTSAYSANAFATDTWYEIELDFFEDATNGSYTLKVDGEEWLSATGLETNDPDQTSDNRILAMGDVSSGRYNSVDKDIWIDHVRWYRGDVAYADIPAASPSPTPSPASETPASNTTNATSSVLNEEAKPSCTQFPPVGTPNLFQANTTPTSAEIFLEPPSAPYDRFFISYGLNSKNHEYGTEFIQNWSTGAVKYSLRDLQPNTTYYVSSRAGNGCMPGEWGNEITIKTPKSSSLKGTTYFQNDLFEFFNLN